MLFAFSQDIAQAYIQIFDDYNDSTPHTHTGFGLECRAVRLVVWLFECSVVASDNDDV